MYNIHHLKLSYLKNQQSRAAFICIYYSSIHSLALPHNIRSIHRWAQLYYLFNQVSQANEITLTWPGGFKQNK